MAATVDQALALVRSMPKIDGALLDINLRGERPAYAVADDLIARRLPFVFTTGYSAQIIPKGYRHVRCLKPFIRISSRRCFQTRS